MYSSLKKGVEKKGAREGEGGEEGCMANRNAQLKAQEDRHSAPSLLTLRRSLHIQAWFYLAKALGGDLRHLPETYLR